jgi:hypothetical protein
MSGVIIMVLFHSIFLGLYLQMRFLLSWNMLNHVILISIGDIVEIIAKPISALDGGVADDARHRSLMSAGETSKIMLTLSHMVGFA